MRCALRLLITANDLWHRSHWCGRSPECVSMCVFTWLDEENCLPQTCARQDDMEASEVDVDIEKQS